MSDMMTFPATVEEFIEQYKIVDDEKVYTNGADLVPIFRMMQWFEHVSATNINVGDMINRQQAIDAMCLACGHDCDKSKFVYNAPQDEQVIMCPEHYALSTMPSAQPEPCEDAVSRKAAIDGLNDAVHEHNITDFDAVATILALPPVTPKQRTDLLKAEIKRMKRSFTICINRDYYTGYMSALSAVEGYIAEWEGDAE